MSENESPEWYYVGHYGQLGPLTMQNMVELVTDGVIESDTYVWNPKMPDWEIASNVPELLRHFSRPQSPPPTPGGNITPPAAPGYTDPRVLRNISPYQSQMPASQPYGTHQWMVGPMSGVKSDKNRLTAAGLNIIPGIGRLYLGHTAVGILQLLTSACMVGAIWSWIDAVYILSGGVKTDGYGRELPD